MSSTDHVLECVADLRLLSVLPPVIANYGASQGFDTDDGSSWYDIHDNFMFMADAWKMDYGGHDSRFTDNVVYHAHNDGQNCCEHNAFTPALSVLSVVSG